jgi:YrbI family 3-deoxy-D-manno-octulosonate 8-phosphate phosphatase
MVANAEVLALIPARGGSKSLPRKNIRGFAGFPLIAYSVAAGLQAAFVDRVVVTTDDEEIAEIARSFGAEVPFLRPSDLALDSTPDHPVFMHALDWLQVEENYIPDLVVQLRPTTPIRPRDCVDRGVSLLLENQEADSVRAVVPSGQNPFKMWRIAEGGFIEPILNEGIEEAYNQPRQNLPLTYWQTGHLDVIRTSVIKEQGSMSGKTILPLILDVMLTVDIDSALDWERAEWNYLRSDLDVIRPGKSPRPLPNPVELLVMDFDGVFTDNRVWTDASGNEWVAANRSDGWGIARLKESGIPILVLSTETNPVVSARCEKLGIEVVQGVDDKGSALSALLQERGVNPDKAIYLANDVNDLPCFPIVGCAVVVVDAHPVVKTQADLILKSRGGFGAIRELCELVLDQM